MFSVGQRVVCVNAGVIDAHIPGNDPPLMVGRVYIVGGMLTCGCGASMVDVGLSSPYPTMCACGRITSDGWWVYASRFAPIEEISDTTVEDILEAITVPKA